MYLDDSQRLVRALMICVYVDAGCLPKQPHYANKYRRERNSRDLIYFYIVMKLHSLIFLGQFGVNTVSKNSRLTDYIQQKSGKKIDRRR